MCVVFFMWFASSVTQLIDFLLFSSYSKVYFQIRELHNHSYDPRMSRLYNQVLDIFISKGDECQEYASIKHKLLNSIKSLKT